MGLRDLNPFSYPKIEMNYLSDKRDMAYMVGGCKMTHQILKNGKFFKDNCVEIEDVAEFTKDEQYE